MPHLVVTSAKVALDIHFDHAIIIGRHIANSLPIPDDEISRRHAQIFPKNGSFWISDLGSRNGIYVNGEKTNEQELQPGDEIALGMSLFFYEPPEGVELRDMLSSRGAVLWNKLPPDPEYSIFQVSSFSQVEIEEVMAEWLDKGAAIASVSPAASRHLLQYALGTDQYSTREALCEGTLSFVKEHIGGERLAFFVMDEKGKKLEQTAILQSQDAKELDLGREVLRIIAEGERAVFCSDCANDFRFSRLIKEKDNMLGSFIAAPIFLKERLYGFIYADQPSGAEPLGFKHLLKAYIVGSMFAKCMHWHLAIGKAK